MREGSKGRGMKKKVAQFLHLETGKMVTKLSSLAGDSA